MISFYYREGHVIYLSTNHRSEKGRSYELANRVGKKKIKTTKVISESILILCSTIVIPGWCSFARD